MSSFRRITEIAYPDGNLFRREIRTESPRQLTSEAKYQRDLLAFKKRIEEKAVYNQFLPDRMQIDPAKAPLAKELLEELWTVCPKPTDDKIEGTTHDSGYSGVRIRFKR